MPGYTYVHSFGMSERGREAGRMDGCGGAVQKEKIRLTNDLHGLTYWLLPCALRLPRAMDKRCFLGALAMLCGFKWCLNGRR